MKKFIAVTLLALVMAAPATAHHRENHSQGGGGNSSDDRESFNSGVLMGDMFLFSPSEDTTVSSKSKPVPSVSELKVKNSRKVETRSFLKFDVSGVFGTVLSA